ncbi:serine/threonine-protein kinase dbf2, partial [Coemansia sp. RSA 2703]
MSDRLAQGMDYGHQDRHPAFAEGMMHHMFSTPATIAQQQQQQQQHVYNQQMHYAQLQQQQQQQAPVASIHQTMVGQQSASPSQFAMHTGSGNSALLAQQMRRMRQSPAAGISNVDSMSIDTAAPALNPAPGSMTRRNAFLDTIDPAIRRKVEAAQVYFLEYYVDHLTYIANRRRRLDDFKNVMRSAQTTRQHVQESWAAHCSSETAILRRRRNRTREREFDILAQIGQGGYGQVFLARKRDTGEVCALKKMAKKLLVKLGEVQHILTERDILRTSRSEWLVRLLYSFQDQNSLYLAMEYVPGGDVRTLLNQNGILRHQIARFYIAEMLVAVAALHTFGYFHRDLKPENFLVDATGHVKLTDFGLSHGHLSRPTLEAMKKKLDR